MVFTKSRFIWGNDVHLKYTLFPFAALCCLAMTSQAQHQNPPVHKPSSGVSAFFVGPPDTLPAGWTKDETWGFGVSGLDRKTLSAAAKAGQLTLSRNGLPQSNYRIAILTQGNSGLARIAGQSVWVALNNLTSYDEWTDLGTVTNSTAVSVEVTNSTSGLKVSGLVLEGDVLPPAKSVATVYAALTNGQPVTIAIVGDSVTENAHGTGGGASSLGKGAPGLMQSWVAGFGTTTEYVPHRDPPGWPEMIGASDNFNVLSNYWPGTTFKGTRNVRDGRTSRTATSAIINMGKGGAASDGAWLRFFDEFLEFTQWGKNASSNWTDYSNSTSPPALRYGLMHYQPDIVVINFGANDANGSHIGWTAEDYTWWIKVLVTQIRDRLNAAVVLSTPALWTGGSHQFPHTGPLFAFAARDYCAASGVVLADAYNEYADGHFDGIHPGDTGHQHLFDGYRKAIQGIASSPARTSKINPAQFAASGPIVVDVATRLMWARDAGAGPMTTNAAAVFIAGLNTTNFAGYSDWRLPTREEVMALVDHHARYPAIARDYPFINVVSNPILTSTFSKISTTIYPWFVDIGSGTAYFPNPANPAGSVWPVRDTGAGTAYASWQITYFGNTTNSNAAMTADPDHDGIVNMLEYAQGGNPLAPAVIRPALRVEGPHTNFQYRRGAATDATYRVFQSTNLLQGGWAEVVAPAIYGSNGQYQVTVDTSGAARFFRLRVELP